MMEQNNNKKTNGRLLQSCHRWVGSLAANLREVSKDLALAKIRVLIGTAREGVIPRGDAAWQVEKASLDSTVRCTEMGVVLFLSLFF